MLGGNVRAPPVSIVPCPARTLLADHLQAEWRVVAARPWLARSRHLSRAASKTIDPADEAVGRPRRQRRRWGGPGINCGAGAKATRSK